MSEYKVHEVSYINRKTEKNNLSIRIHILDANAVYWCECCLSHLSEQTGMIKVRLWKNDGIVAESVKQNVLFVCLCYSTSLTIVYEVSFIMKEHRLYLLGCLVLASDSAAG